MKTKKTITKFNFDFKLCLDKHYLAVYKSSINTSVTCFTVLQWI